MESNKVRKINRVMFLSDKRILTVYTVKPFFTGYGFTISSRLLTA